MAVLFSPSALQFLSKNNEFPFKIPQPLFSKWEKVNMFIARVIENRKKKDWNPAEARDFIDASLQEMEKMGNQRVFSWVLFLKRNKEILAHNAMQITKNLES